MTGNIFDFKPIVKFVAFLTSLIKKSTQLFKENYSFIKF